MSRFLLYSSDCHGGLVTDDYPAYFDPKYQSALASYLASERAKRNPDLRKGEQAADALSRDYERRVTYATQLPARIPVLEEEGFVGEVLFPDGGGGVNNGIPFSALFGSVGKYELELYAAGLRAYNRWLGTTAVPDRQIGLGLIPLHDPEYAVEQARGMRALGLRGVIPQWDGTDLSGPPIYDESLDPLWDVCEQEELPVNIHSGCGIPQKMYLRDRATPHGSYVAQVENHFWGRRALWHLILGGVLERHPQLTVGFIELNSDWIPRTLRYLDWYWETKQGNASFESVCPNRPSEYWARQCFTGASPMSLYEVQHLDDFPEGTFAFGTDFPHPTSPWGTTREFLRSTIGLGGVGEKEARAILGESLLKIYKLDAKKLGEIAARVGPTADEILQVPKGTDPTDGLADYIRARTVRPEAML